MRLLKAGLAVIGLAILLDTPALSAQENRQFSPVSRAGSSAARRSGFWFGGGLASARADVNCNICVNDPKSEMSANLNGGLSLTPGLLLGLEGTGAVNSEDGVDERYVAFSVIVYSYPMGKGLFLKGGLGLIDYRAHDDVDEFTSRPLMAQIGGGYEVHVASNISVLPYINLLASSKGDLDFNGTRVTDDVSFTLLQFGVGVTFR
ncbi:MAG: hypothetical protein ABI613_06610 [Gemmatimonadota bacterium]